MRTLLSFLVALLAVASPTLAQTFRAASSNSTYIAYRTDGRAGTGTLTDPYNGSTANRLDTLLSNAPAGQVIYFLPSLNYQSQPFALSGAGTAVRRYNHKDNQTYIGIGGAEAVRITLSTNTPIGGADGAGAAFFGETPYAKTNVTWKGIHFDGNYTNFSRHNRASNAFSAIGIYGDFNTVEDCKVTGMWGDYGVGSLAGKEGFPIFMSSAFNVGGDTSNRYGGNVIRRTTLINDIPALTNGVQNRFAYVNALNAYGRIANGSNYLNFQTNYVPGVVEDCLVINAAGGGLLSGVGADIIRGNRVMNTKLVYQDTWRQGKWLIENNHVTTSNSQVIQMAITTNSSITYAIAGPIDIINNTFEITTNSGGNNPNGSHGFIYLHSSPRNIQAVSPGVSNWVGFKDVRIAGNRFKGDRYAPGISGSFLNLSVSGNHFEAVGSPLIVGGFSTNISFTGNTVIDGLFGVELEPSGAAGSFNSENAVITGNTFDQMRRFALLMAGWNNVRFDGNTVNGWGLFAPASPEQAHALFVGTNAFAAWLGAANSGPFTNFSAVGNTFTASTNFSSAPYVGRYSVTLTPGVRDAIVANNFDTSYNGPNIDAAVAGIGTRVQTAIYITNSGGLAGVYTNGVLLTPAAGGSESTAPGTNLVMAGTTLSLSNTIINDAAKWRSNSSYLGGALVAGEAVSWSSNGTWHLTFPHGTALTVGSNGVILTNGVALATGSGGGSSLGTNLFVNGILSQPARLTNSTTVTWSTNSGGDIEGFALGSALPLVTNTIAAFNTVYTAPTTQDGYASAVVQAVGDGSDVGRAVLVVNGYSAATVQEATMEPNNLTLNAFIPRGATYYVTNISDAGGSATFSAGRAIFGGTGGLSAMVNNILAGTVRLTNSATVTWATNANGDIAATAMVGGNWAATAIDDTQLHTNSGTLGIKRMAMMTNIVLEGATITNDTATSIPLIVDTTSTNRLVSYRVSGSERLGITDNGYIYGLTGMQWGTGTGNYLSAVTGGTLGSRFAFAPAGTIRQISHNGGFHLGSGQFITWDNQTGPQSFYDATLFRPTTGTLEIKTNLQVYSTITATNGYITPISALPSSGVLWVNFSPTNQWQSNSVTGNIEIALTNIVAGVSRQLRLECASGGPHTITWTHAFNNATALPAAITNGNVYVIAFDSWGTTTNELTGAGRFFR